MKLLGNIIGGLIAAVLGAIALAFFQPVVEAASPDPPLKATIEASRWLEKPRKAGADRTVLTNNPSLEKLYHDVWMSPEQNKFLAILFSNERKETVKDLRIRIEDEDEQPTAMAVSNNGLNRNVIMEKSNFLLPDMKPGEQIRVYLWAETALPCGLLPHNLKLFSSIRPVEITHAQLEEKQHFVREYPFLILSTSGSALYLL